MYGLGLGGLVDLGEFAIDDVVVLRFGLRFFSHRRFVSRRVFHQRLFCVRQRQRAVAHAEPFEQILNLSGQIAAQAHKPTRAHR